MSSPSSDAALMLGPDRASVAGTDNNTMSGMSSESGQQADGTESPKDQFYGESPADDYYENRQQLYQVFEEEMEAEKVAVHEEELRQNALTLIQSEEAVTDEPGEDLATHGDTEEDIQLREDNLHDMYKINARVLKHLQERADFKEAEDTEARCYSPPSRFGEVSQEELQEDYFKNEEPSVTEFEESLLTMAHETDTKGREEEDTHEESRKEDELQDKKGITQPSYDSHFEINDSTWPSAFPESNTGAQFDKTWFSEQSQQDRVSVQTSYSYSFEDQLGVTTTKKTYQAFTSGEPFQASSEYKASSLIMHSDHFSDLDQQIRHGYSFGYHEMEGELFAKLAMALCFNIRLHTCIMLDICKSIQIVLSLYFLSFFFPPLC